jgi:hypothetical protein
VPLPWDIASGDALDDVIDLGDIELADDAHNISWYDNIGVTEHTKQCPSWSKF